MLKKLAIVLTLALSSCAFGQGSSPSGPPIAFNQAGQPVPNATVAICTSDPGSTPTSVCNTLATTYTDITLGTICSGSPGTLPLNNRSNPSTGSGCSNPGHADLLGNAVAFTAAGTYFCEYYGPGINGFFAQPCPAGGGGGGGGGSPGSPNLALQFNNTAVFTGAPGTSVNLSTGQLDIANQSNIRVAVAALNWSQNPSGTLTGGSPSTVTLSPCPAGIDGRDNISYVYISGIGGTAEPVEMTGGGTCRPGAGSGTITFTPLNNHTAGYTIGSGSQGIQEAINGFANWTGTGGKADATVILEPGGLPVANGNVANLYTINAPITAGGLNVLNLIGNNAVFFCNTRDYCINSTGIMTIRDIRLASNLQVNGAIVSNVVCTAGVATITTAANHPFITGDFVDIHDVDDPFYWGGSVSQNTRITVTGATTFTYPIASGNCASGGGSTRASLNTPGTANILNAAYFGGAGSITGSVLSGLRLDIPGGNSSLAAGHFNNGVVVMDDEAFRVQNMTGGSLNAKSGPNFMCSTANPYCGAEIYAPGPFTGGSGVLWISDSDLTAQCTANPVVAFNGNTVHLNNVIAQSQAKVAVLASSRRGGFGNVLLDNVYDEQGNCFNPDSGLAASEGFSFYGNAAKISGGEGPQALIPNFGGAGGTTFYYYIVPNNGSTDAPPLFLGTATPSGAVNIQFPRVMPIVNGTTNITYTQPTYSVIRTTDQLNYPTTAGCPGGSPTACGTVTTGIAQGTGLWIPFTDNSATSTTAVTVNVASAYNPEATFWPGHIILGGGATVYLDTNTLVPTGSTIVTWTGPSTNNVYTLRNSGNQQYVSGFSAGSNATLLNDFNNNTGLKGAVNMFHAFGSTAIGATELFTLVDSNPTKTIANQSKRPTQDAADTFFGNDNPSATNSTVGLAIGAPTSISSYINTAINNFNSGWLERLTSTKKEFAIATQFDTPMTAVNGCFGCSPFYFIGTQVSDTFNRANGGLGANWTNATGSCQIVSNAASMLTFTGGFNFATCPYTGSSFTGDHFAQGTIQAGNTGAVLGVGVRMDSVAQTAYYIECGGIGNPYFFGKVVAGANSNFVTTGTCAVGDVVKIGVAGSTIYTYLNGKTFTAPVTDTAIPSGGSPGIIFQNGTAGNARLVSFFGGDFPQTNVFPIGNISAATYATNVNCSAAGSAANPSLVACTSAPAGAFSCATNASTGTCTVSTTAVTTNSDIEITATASAGARLGVTCNTTADTPTGPRVASISNGVSFTINLGSFATNPECYFYKLTN